MRVSSSSRGACWKGSLFPLARSDLSGLDIVNASYLLAILSCSRFSGRAFGRLRGDYGWFGVVRGG